MTEKQIPEHIDPYRYTEQGLGLSGAVSISDMSRLNASMNAGGGVVKVDLRFGRDEQGIPFLKGHLETSLTLQCQRCMEPFIYEIISDFALGIVDSIDESNTLPEHYEPVITQEGHLALRELVEDEIILNLPIIPRHAPEDCQVKLPYMDLGVEQDKGENPFHVLKTLKKDEQK